MGLAQRDDDLMGKFILTAKIKKWITSFHQSQYSKLPSFHYSMAGANS
jgi:hypothetical protein